MLKYVKNMRFTRNMREREREKESMAFLCTYDMNWNENVESHSTLVFGIRFPKNVSLW